MKNPNKSFGTVTFAFSREKAHTEFATVAYDGSTASRATFSFYYALLKLAVPYGFAKLLSMLKEKTMPIGTVKFFNSDKGYGFIQPEDGGNDAFVHISAVEQAGMSTLNKEQRVSYELEQDRRGKTSAVNLQSA